ERCRVGVDLVAEVHERGAAAHPDDGRAVTARDGDTPERGCLHLLELLALGALGLAPAHRTAATAAEGALGAAAATGTTGAAAAEATGTSPPGTGGAAGTAAATRRALPGTRDSRPVRHHAGVRTGSPRARSRRARACGTPTGRRPGHALARREGVVAG